MTVISPSSALCFRPDWYEAGKLPWWRSLLMTGPGTLRQWLWGACTCMPSALGVSSVTVIRCLFHCKPESPCEHAAGMEPNTCRRWELPAELASEACLPLACFWMLGVHGVWHSWQAGWYSARGSRDGLVSSSGLMLSFRRVGHRATGEPGWREDGCVPAVLPFR